MSVLGIIVLIVVIAAILFALFVFLPRLREKGRIKARERELKQRRKRVISEQREEAERRTERAEAGERRAEIAAAEARRERAEAEVREKRAALHEQGMADHELVADHERDRFAGTGAAPEEQPREDGDRGHRERERTGAYQEGRRSAHDPSRAEDFQQGRRDEAGDDGDGLLGRFRRRKSQQEPAGRR